MGKHSHFSSKFGTILDPTVVVHTGDKEPDDDGSQYRSLTDLVMSEGNARVVIGFPGPLFAAQCWFTMYYPTVNH
jgi:hypothetical protein